MVFFSFVALSALARADAETPAQSRATIRGTGKDVAIVYRGSAAKPRRAEAPAAFDVVAEAARMASAGADEQSLLAYLRTHQAQLPAVVGVDDVRRLRKAGASPAVITDLSRMTALDIGETAEGAPGYSDGGAGAPEMGYPSADMGYPFYGAYGGGGGFGFAHRHGGRFGPHHPSVFPMRRMVAPRPFGSPRPFGTHAFSMQSGGMRGGIRPPRQP